MFVDLRNARIISEKSTFVDGTVWVFFSDFSHITVVIVTTERAIAINN